MGAWGHGTFENDDAQDWMSELLDADDLAAIHDALGELGNDDGYLEAPECSMVLAAAEVVAALGGNPSDSLPKEIAAWVKGKRNPSKKLKKDALAAVAAVKKSSELKDLWEESDDFAAWLSSLEDLEQRLGD